MNEPFEGAKLAVLYRGRVLSVLRDAVADIPFPGMWDLPGGGREGNETPEECALREAREETGLVLPKGAVGWARPHRGGGGAALRWFLAAEVTEVRGLRLGDEGQALRWFGIADFLSRRDAVPHLQVWLRNWLDHRKGGR